MVAIWKCRVGLGVGFGLVASFFTWLVLGDKSPLADYFLQHVTLPNVLRTMLTIPYAVLVVLRPKSGAYVIGYGLIFLQWLIVCLLLSLLVCRRAG